VHVRDVILQVRLSREAHWTTDDGALEDSLVCVLTQVLAQRLSTEELFADLTFEFLLRVVVDWKLMEQLVEKKFSMRVGAVWRKKGFN
jgi:hypothetical protein